MERVFINDVTLREYGQNVPAGYLGIFTPRRRAEMALALIQAGFSGIEIFSCVNPAVAPAMEEEALREVVHLIGRAEETRLTTLVPNRTGYDTFLRLGLGPEGYNHTMGVFFSSVESHNIANLGRPIKKTLEEYRPILQDALSRGIRAVAYVSAVFGYRDPEKGEVVHAGIDEINGYIDLLFDLGAETVTLSDLQGVADEEETARIISAIVEKRTEAEIRLLGYHPHNLSEERALANSAAAYSIGIRRFDSSLGGTGGCITGAPGNQPTEGLIRYFHHRGVETGIDQGLVDSLSGRVHREFYSRIPLPLPSRS